MFEALTVCIPTYNREKELRETLESLARVLGNTVHVVISDNASTDKTADLCEEYASSNRFLSFRSHRWDKNMGADENYLKAVELSTTEFCLLFGSDDCLVDHAAGMISQAMADHLDITVFGRELHSKDLSVFYGTECYWIDGHDRIFTIASPDDFNRYTDQCTSLAAVFSYLSVILIKRSVWIVNEEVRRFVGSAYVHVAAILEGMKNRPVRLCAEPEPLVKCRTNNDFFMSEGRAKRAMIDWQGFGELEKAYFPDNPGLLTKIFQYEYSPRKMLRLSFHVRREKDKVGQNRVEEYLRNSPWGTRQFSLWRRLKWIPLWVFTVLFFIHNTIK